MEEDYDILKKSLTIYEVFIYALTYTIIFVYLYEDISYNIILIVLLIIHVLFGTKMYNIVNDVKPDATDFKLLLNFIPVIIIGSLIVRSISLLFYTYGYTNAKMKLYNLGETYDPPSKYKVPEATYKLSYVISTICLFLIFSVYMLDKNMLKVDSFGFSDIDKENGIPMIAISVLGFLIYLHNDFGTYYQHAIYVIGTILLFMILLAATLVIHPSINNYTLPILITSLFGLFGYVIDLSISKDKDKEIKNEGRIYSSISGFIFSLMVPYIPYIQNINFDTNENHIKILIQSILGLSSGTLVTTSVFEMINSIDYEKYHHKIYKYKKDEDSDDTELEEIKTDIISIIINIFIIIVCGLLLFAIFLYSFGINSQNIIIGFLFSGILTTYFSYNSEFNTIIGLIHNKQ